MKKSFLSEIQGQEMWITQISIDSSDESLEMQWTIACDNCAYRIHFCNVSRLSFDYVSYPMKIGCFEMLCNVDNGWDRDSRLFIHDLDDQSISFYCEDCVIEGPK